MSALLIMIAILMVFAMMALVNVNLLGIQNLTVQVIYSLIYDTPGPFITIFGSGKESCYPNSCLQIYLVNILTKQIPPFGLCCFEIWP